VFSQKIQTSEVECGRGIVQIIYLPLNDGWMVQIENVHMCTNSGYVHSEYKCDAASATTVSWWHCDVDFGMVPPHCLILCCCDL
jgi:hypothetical protein